MIFNRFASSRYKNFIIDWLGTFAGFCEGTFIGSYMGTCLGKKPLHGSAQVCFTGKYAAQTAYDGSYVRTYEGSFTESRKGSCEGTHKWIHIPVQVPILEPFKGTFIGLSEGKEPSQVLIWENVNNFQNFQIGSLELSGIGKFIRIDSDSFKLKVLDWNKLKICYWLIFNRFASSRYKNFIMNWLGMVWISVKRNFGLGWNRME